MSDKPAKPFNQRIRIWGLRLFFLAAVPLILLYELGILMASIIGRPDNGPALSPPAD